MQYKICEKNAIRVVGVKIPLVEDHEMNMILISQFWSQTIGTRRFEEICTLAEQELQGVLGISVYFDPQHIYYYIAAATNHPNPVGMEEFLIPATTWCVVTGAPCKATNFMDMFKGFWTEFLPFSGLKYAELPDIEVYPIEGEGKTFPIKEMWLAVKQAD